MTVSRHATSNNSICLPHGSLPSATRHGAATPIRSSSESRISTTRFWRAPVGGSASTALTSAMFQLLRQFWLGNDSLQSVLEYTEYEPIAEPAPIELPTLPDRFVAIKF